MPDELRPKPPPKAIRRFPLVPFDQIRLQDGPAYLVKHLVPREGLVLIWGPPKCGKSFFVIDLVLHVALGWEYRGRRVTAGAVVYVACEGERGLNARIEAWRRERLSEEPGAVPFHLLTSRLDLRRDHSALITDIRDQLGSAAPCAAIVIDTLNRSLTGSESSDEDMAAYIQAADAVREAFGCAVLIVHHCGHDDKRPRGHSSLGGAIDAQIAIRKDAGEVVSATVELMKDGPAGARVASRLKVIELGTDEDGDPITSCVVDAIEATSALNKPRVCLSGKRKIVFEMLSRAIDEAGEMPPLNPHIPEGLRAVTIDVARRYAYQGLISETTGAADRPTADAKLKAFSRAITDLQTAGLIAIREGWIWKASR